MRAAATDPLWAQIDNRENCACNHAAHRLGTNWTASAAITVATTSEFGRRAEQNSNGLDHGTATVGMLAGAVHAGVFGQHPNWGTLDTNDNLRCTVTMGEYYATLAQWMGVNPGDVLAGNPAPLAGVTL